MIYTRKPDIVTRQIAGETLLVPVRGRLADLQRLFALEGVGEFIWNLLDGQTSEVLIVEAVCARYEVDAAVAARDLAEFLAAAQESGLIEPVTGAPT